MAGLGFFAGWIRRVKMFFEYWCPVCFWVLCWIKTKTGKILKEILDWAATIAWLLSRICLMPIEWYEKNTLYGDTGWKFIKRNKNTIIVLCSIFALVLVAIVDRNHYIASKAREFMPAVKTLKHKVYDEIGGGVMAGKDILDAMTGWTQGVMDSLNPKLIFLFLIPVALVFVYFFRKGGPDKPRKK